MSGSPQSSPHDSAEAGQLQLPSAELRNGLTLLLILHLFALFVAVVSNFGARSGLRLQLREVPGVRTYLQLLNMDTAYNYHFVFGTREDRDYQCEVMVRPPPRSATSQAGGPLQEESLRLIPADLWPGSRRRRYLMLSHHMAANVGDDQLESLLPATLASGLLRQRGVTEGTHLLRLIGLAPASRDNADTRRPEEWGPVVVYEADLLPGTGGWEPVKRSDVTERTQSSSPDSSP